MILKEGMSIRSWDRDLRFLKGDSMEWHGAKMRKEVAWTKWLDFQWYLYIEKVVMQNVVPDKCLNISDVSKSKWNFSYTQRDV